MDTELLRGGLVEHLYNTKYKGTVHAGVDPKNPASARVLQKAPFTAKDDEIPKDGVGWFQPSFSPWVNGY